ncbi:hypothetical protein LUZ60_005701 [Juncus effusus]|nr:hypothetical protein LUZ60_005701 [Juncus effusus]
MAGEMTTMDEKLDKVFVSLSLSSIDSSHEMLVLEWALDHFDSDKTKIFLIFIRGSLRCVDLAERDFLPRCKEKKFRAEILMSIFYGAKEAILNATKGGMGKFVIGATHWNKVSELFNEMVDLSCKVWIVNEDNGILNYVRDTRLHHSGSATQKDMEELLQRETNLHRQAIGQKPRNLDTRLLVKENEQLKSERQHLKDKFEENFRKLVEANGRNQDLQVSLRRVEDQCDSLQSRYDKLHEERDKIEEERNKLKEEQNELQKMLIDTTREKKNLQAHNQYLSGQKVGLEKIISDSELARKDLQAALATIEERFDSLHISCSIPSFEFTLQELEHATQNFSDSLQIGKGGYGSVYKGYLRGINVAIKILNSRNTESVSGFKREVTILSAVRHPNLVTLMGACSESSTLVYEFLPNGSLEDHLNRANNSTPLTWQVRTRIISEICLALIFLHSNKPDLIIHGDLKPDNVLLDANFVSKLCDFGISRLVKRPDINTTPFCSTYSFLGTPGYIDPDFVRSGQLTEKSDVYSFGIIILRLVTGKPVVNITSKVQEAMEKRTFQEIIDVHAGKWPVDQAKGLAMLGLRCTEMNRKDRPNLFSEVWPIVERLQRQSIKL